MAKPSCSTPECERPTQARGLCATHYSYWWRENNTMKRVCTQCGETYRPTRGSQQKTCSTSCHSKAANEARLTSPGWIKYQMRVQAAKKPKPMPAKIKFWRRQECENCSTQYLTRVPHSQYCSPRCRSRAKERRRTEARGEFSISDATRVRIYVRDGYTCHLCGGHVDTSLHHYDRMSATLDHLVPQSATSAPDHSETNLKTAHRICNSLRGNKPIEHWDR